MAKSAPRTYRSTVRAEGQRRTVQRIVAAAADLFLATGYAATTIDAVAARAGVSRRTVFAAVGGKSALLKLAYDWSLVGDDEPVAMAERPAIQAIAAEPDPARSTRLWTAHHVAVSHRSAPLALVLVLAADTDSEAAALLAKSRADSRLGATMFVRHLQQIGGLRAGLTLEGAAETCWALMLPELYDRLSGAGWSDEQIADWIAGILTHSLLAPSPRVAPPEPTELDSALVAVSRRPSTQRSSRDAHFHETASRRLQQ